MPLRVALFMASSITVSLSSRIIHHTAPLRTNLSEHDNSCAVNAYGAGERRRGVTRKRGGALGHRHARNPRNPKPFHHTQASPSPQSLTITTAVPSRHSPQQSDTLHIHPTITHTVRTTVYTHRAPHTAVTVALHCTVGTVCTGRNTGPLDPAVDFSNSSDTVP